jgi:hypothetical protein
MAENTKYPSEVVDLPSKGWYYDESSPLSGGRIELKLMTAKEENILASTNLVEKGVAIDRLLEALIIDENIKYTDLLIGDKNGIMFAARILGYGKDYRITSLCPFCEKVHQAVIDLSKVDSTKVDLKEENRGKNSFQFQLPASKRTLTFKLLTHGDELNIDREVRALENIRKPEDKEIDLDFTTRLFYSITAVDGNSELSVRKNFIENEFLARDSLAFRNHVQSIRPDIDMSSEIECPNCKNRRRVRIPITSEFFWPGEGISYPATQRYSRYDYL